MLLSLRSGAVASIRGCKYQSVRRGDNVATLIVHHDAAADHGPSMRKPLRVVLTLKMDSSTVNICDLLVAHGFACKADQQVLKSWDPMADDYFSERNSYQVDIDDPGVATVGYKAHDEERICRFFNMRSGCWKGDNCPNEHIRYTDITGVTNDQRSVYYIDDIGFVVELPSAGDWVLVQVTHIFAPDHVCVVFPYGIKTYHELLGDIQTADDKAAELQQFHNDLHSHYARKMFPDSDLILFGYGELIMAKFSGTKRWCRARVIGRDSDHSVKVQYVDYGNAEWVTPDRIRQMEPQFLHLPSQAVHCYLPICSQLPDGRWDSSARQVFEELVSGKILAARVLTSCPDGIMQAELHDGNEWNICEEMINLNLASREFKNWLPNVPSASADQQSIVYIPS